MPVGGEPAAGRRSGCRSGHRAGSVPPSRPAAPARCRQGAAGADRRRPARRSRPAGRPGTSAPLRTAGSPRPSGGAGRPSGSPGGRGRPRRRGGRGSRSGGRGGPRPERRRRPAGRRPGPGRAAPAVDGGTGPASGGGTGPDRRVPGRRPAARRSWSRRRSRTAGPAAGRDGEACRRPPGWPASSRSDDPAASASGTRRRSTARPARSPAASASDRSPGASASHPRIRPRASPPPDRSGAVVVPQPRHDPERLSTAPDDVRAVEPGHRPGGTMEMRTDRVGLLLDQLGLVRRHHPGAADRPDRRRIPLGAGAGVVVGPAARARPPAPIRTGRASGCWTGTGAIRSPSRSPRSPGGSVT